MQLKLPVRSWGPWPPCHSTASGVSTPAPTPGPRGRARVPETPPAWTQDSCPSLHLFTVQTGAHPASLGGEAFQTVVTSPAKQQGSCEAPFQLGPRRHTWLPVLGGPSVHLPWAPEPPRPTLQGPGVSPPASSPSQQERAPRLLRAQGYAFFPRKPTSLEASSPAALYFLFRSPSERRFLAETLCVCVSASVCHTHTHTRTQVTHSSYNTLQPQSLFARRVPGALGRVFLPRGWTRLPRDQSPGQ